MFELIAQGPEPRQAWRKRLPLDATVRLGRAPRHGFAAPWDLYISREHADLMLSGDKLIVHKLASARSPIFQREQPLEELEISPGDAFTIGKTVFRLERAPGEVGILRSRVISRDESDAVPFAAAHERLELLSRLPDLLAHSHREEDLAAATADMLLAGIPAASAAAVVQPPSEAQPTGVICHRVRGPDDDFAPSRTLVRETLDDQRTRLHMWTLTDVQSLTYTSSNGLDWAFCMPIRSNVRSDWGLYVAGCNQRLQVAQAESLDQSLLPDVRFAELLARFLGAVYDLRSAERQRATLSQFFSPTVMEMLIDASDESLRPKPHPVTALFCDLRGFSRASEQAETLNNLLEDVSTALGLVTQEIIRLDGAISDFQGDSVLGFWGWPMDEAEGPADACRAALAIQSSFRRARQRRAHGASHFRIGIGIAHGVALAGRIGTKEQAKMGIFGPVVNVGSRLEGLTSAWGDTILLNDAAASEARASLTPQEGVFRHLGRFRLYGMQQPVAVHELLPLEPEGGPFSAEYLREFESGVQALFAGDWETARHCLTTLPGTDAARQTLVDFMLRGGGNPPAEWDGVVPIGFKAVEPATHGTDGPG